MVPRSEPVSELGGTEACPFPASQNGSRARLRIRPRSRVFPLNRFWCSRSRLFSYCRPNRDEASGGPDDEAESLACRRGRSFGSAQGDPQRLSRWCLCESSVQFNPPGASFQNICRNRSSATARRLARLGGTIDGRSMLRERKASRSRHLLGRTPSLTLQILQRRALRRSSEPRVSSRLHPPQPQRVAILHSRLPRPGRSGCRDLGRGERTINLRPVR